MPVSACHRVMLHLIATVRYPLSICALRPEGFLIVYVHVRGGVLVFEEVVWFFYYYLPVVRVEYS